MEKPILAITMGDPAGIGPEITVKALLKQDIYDKCCPLVIGDANVMKHMISMLGKEKEVQVHSIKDVKDAKFSFGTIDVYDLNLVDIKELRLGVVSKLGGTVAFECVRVAIELAIQGKVDGTVTNPLNKEALNLAGYSYSGHTEIYADFTNTSKYTMLLAHDNLRVVHVSTHVSLKEACERVKTDRVFDVICIASKACKKLGIENPKVGVAGLNPHCGENGLFGREEIEEIIPAIEKAKKEGIYVEGPIPADTIFSKARGGWYDIVVAMYHDQGHIPLKVVGFVYNEKEQKWDQVSGVNITLGLPIIRTSVDHGTAFDCAGKGVANEISLVNAIDYAIKLATNTDIR